MKNKKEILKQLRKKSFVIGVPVKVNFRTKKKNELVSLKATKGTRVVKWNDMLKAFREEKK